MRAAALIALLLAAADAAPSAAAAGPLPGPAAAPPPAVQAAAATGTPAEPGDAFTEVAARLAGIEQALERIALLLADSLDQQLVNVLMRRIELKERSLQPLQEALQGARSERDSLLEEQKRLKDIMEVMTRPEPGEAADESAGLRQDMEHARRELERMAERAGLLDQRIAEMEGDLGRQRDDIRALEEMVDERIGLR